MTVTLEQIEAAWDEKIWAHEEIQALTDKIHKFEVTDGSEAELGQLTYEGEMNFFEVIVSREVQAEIIGGADTYRCRFPVEIRYTREADIVNGTSYRLLRNALLLVQSLVSSELGITWSGTVERSEFVAEPITITTQTIGDILTFRGVVRFIGFADTNL